MRGYNYSNGLVQAQLFFENAALREDTEKEKFYSELATNLVLFPTSVAHNKVLPHLCMTSAISAKDALLVLSPLLVIGKSLDADEFKKQVEPVVVKLSRRSPSSHGTARVRDTPTHKSYNPSTFFNVTRP